MSDALPGGLSLGVSRLELKEGLHFAMDSSRCVRGKRFGRDPEASQENLKTQRQARLRHCRDVSAPQDEELIIITSSHPQELFIRTMKPQEAPEQSCTIAL